MKKFLSFTLILVACFGLVTLVNAASKYATLGGGSNTGWVTRNSTGTSFYTRVAADAVTGTPTVKTSIQRQVLWIWSTGGTHTFSTNSAGTYTTNWTAKGTNNTRAMWENIADASTTIRANFILDV